MHLVAACIWVARKPSCRSPDPPEPGDSVIVQTTHRPQPVGETAGPEMAHLDMRRFVIVALPRTGTNYLRVTLNQHANIVANNELLSPTDRSWDYAPRAEMSNAELLRLGFHDFPQPESKTDVRAVGFKILDNQLEPGQGRSEFLELLSKDPDVHVLHLTRANPLETSGLSLRRTRPGDGSPAAHANRRICRLSA
jgi:hypothetical protein